MKPDYQLSFSFMDEYEPSKNKATESKPAYLPNNKNFEKDLRRAAIGWVLRHKPTGIGYAVPTRIVKYKADLAAFWSKAETRKGRKNLIPVKAVILEIKTDYKQIISECGKSSSILSRLNAEKDRKKLLEEKIRFSEPHLKLSDNLFSEIESWDYRKSDNREYKEVCSSIEKLERNLNKGSHFERLRQALIADFLYLAVPAGLVKPEELSDGWGLLYINDDMSVDVISEAEDWKCSIENRLHLVQNIAKTNIQTICFANGINLDKNNSPKFVRIPRKRKN